MKRPILFLLLSGMILSIFAYKKNEISAVNLTAQDIETDKDLHIANITAQAVNPSATTKAVKKTATKKTKKNFYTTKITNSVWKRINGKSYRADCTVPREDLRYLHILHKDINGKTHEGELICNAYIAKDVLKIFKQLYKANYPIEKVRLIDEYDADDEKSMEDNNSSSFNFRFISHTTKVSKHGLGLAVDINTLYNPYTKTVNGRQVVEPVTAETYTDRSKSFPYKIDRGDLCYSLFTKYGFEWGGDWKNSKDYQHFEVPDSVVKQLYPNN